MKRLAISLACAILVSGCAAVSGISTPIENTVKIIQNTQRPKPTIILTHGCDGLVAHNYVKGNELAKWGYNIVMVDSFTKRRAWDVCSNPWSVTPIERAKDVAETVKWIQTQSWHQGKIGLIGFSHGGSTALNVVGDKHIKQISAVVAFYPGCGKHFVGQDFRYGFVPLQIHSGSDDAWTPADACKKLIHGPTDQSYELFIYAGATHGFDINYQSRIFSGYFLAYDHTATKLSIDRTKDFFNKHIRN